MDDTERERDTILFQIRTWEFTRLMESHQCLGEAVYYLTESWVLWPDFGYDMEHGYLFN
jgi:hypothetical protein